MSVLSETPRVRVGRLEIRPDESAALVDGKHLELTRRELEILALLAARPDRIMGRHELYEAIWGKPLADNERSVDVYVSRVRGKLAKVLPGTETIHTHSGFGYRFCYSG